MFERFTAAAREAVVDAQQHAARLRHTRIGAEHLLLAVLDRDTTGARVLRSLGADPDAVAAQIPGRDVADARALAALGIDVEEVRRRVEETFGPGSLTAGTQRGRSGRTRHVPFTRPAKKALENALREAVALGHRYIGTEHLVLGLLADESVRRVLAATGVPVDQEEARTAVRHALAEGRS